MIALAILSCDSKSYCLHQHARSVLELEYPREEIRLLGVLDEERGTHPHALLVDFADRYDYALDLLPVKVPGNSDEGDNMNWVQRAHIAATMRQRALLHARETGVSHLFFAGCDMIFPPDTLTRLLRLDNPLATGVYSARIQSFPVVLTYDRATKAWAHIPYRHGVFEADWSGADCLLVRRDAFEAVDWTGFTTDAYNAGEDAWICHRTFEALGTKVAVDGDVTPLHITARGVVMHPEPPFWMDVIEVRCPGCGHAYPAVRNYQDTSVNCWQCREVFPVLPFWEPIPFVLRNAVKQVPYVMLQ